MIPKKTTPVVGEEPIGPTNPMPSDTTSAYIQKFAYNANKLTEYQGWAAPGSAADASVWRIAKFTYGADFLVTDITYADGDVDFDNDWSDRENIDYS